MAPGSVRPRRSSHTTIQRSSPRGRVNTATVWPEPGRTRVVPALPVAVAHLGPAARQDAQSHIDRDAARSGQHFIEWRNGSSRRAASSTGPGPSRWRDAAAAARPRGRPRETAAFDGGVRQRGGRFGASAAGKSVSSNPASCGKGGGCSNGGKFKKTLTFVRRFSNRLPGRTLSRPGGVPSLVSRPRRSGSRRRSPGRE